MGYPTLTALAALRRGEVIDLGGIKLMLAPGEIKPGALFVAERNIGPKLLTAKAIVTDFIIPVDEEYCFDTWECVKVQEA